MKSRKPWRFDAINCFLVAFWRLFTLQTWFSWSFGRAKWRSDQCRLAVGACKMRAWRVWTMWEPWTWATRASRCYGFMVVGMLTMKSMQASGVERRP